MKHTMAAHGGQKIIPHLWYHTHAKKAAEFYVSAFGNGSAVENVSVIRGTPSGDCDIVSFKLWGYSFMSISAGPQFVFNPSISFMVNFDPSQDSKAKERIDETWNAFSKDGKILMPLDQYPFSERYGWVTDRYGLSWQLILTDPKGVKRPPIIPSLLFVSDTGEQAEAATNFYISVFKNAQRGVLVRSGARPQPSKSGALMFTDFTLEGQWFAAMDGNAAMHDFSFNEAVSFMVRCDTQNEIDYYWKKLSAVIEAEQCGWLKDKYGVSWQIVPTIMDKMMNSGDEDTIARVTRVFLKMKKFNIKALRKAYQGK